MEFSSTRAMNIRRVEGGVLDNLSDMDPTMTPFEAGLDRFVVMEGRRFIGRDALVKQKNDGNHQVLVTLKLPYGETSVIADEGVYQDGTLIGRVTSGGFSYYCNHDIAMALVPQKIAKNGTRLQVKIRNEMRAAQVVENCVYDPSGARARA
jgi:dimethylglycine dehydrogenase